MIKEDKEILLRDLCARLPYGVKAYIKNWSKLDQKYYEGVYTVKSVHPSLNDIYASTENASVEVILGYSDYFIRPYLFPLSSMSEEQKVEYDKMCELDIEYTITQIKNNSTIWTTGLNRFNWLLKNHFDVYDLISMDLAFDATNKDIY